LAGPWVAIDSTTDRRQRARRLEAAHDAVLGGGRPDDAVLRDVIVGSWERCREAGVDAEATVAPLGDESEARERWERHPLATALPAVRELLADVGGAAHQVLLFCDADGTLLWIEGERGELRRARDARLEPGADWSEVAAGTNAMGTALATGHPLQVFSAEHYARAVHAWTCSAAPVHDPDTGRVVGVLDLSGSLATAHPHSLAVVTAAARLVEAELRRASDEAAAALVEAFGHRVGGGASRAHALAAATGRVLVSAHGDLAGRRLAVPADGGVVTLPSGAAALAEPLPGGRGFLLYPAGPPPHPAPPHPATSPTVPGPFGDLRATTALRSPHAPGGEGDAAVAAAPVAGMRIDALGRRAVLHLDGERHPLSPRHGELLMLLVLRPTGWSAEQLAAELLGDLGKPVSIRAELSRLRRILGDRLQAQPYRLTEVPATDVAELERALAEGRTADALVRFARGELLPTSDSATIAETRFRLAMALREAVIASAEPDLLRDWLTLPAGDDDAQACRVLMSLTAPSDPRHALAAGRLRRLAGAR
jgi:hypothetical protein